MSDLPLPERQGKTPLSLARKPNIDRLASQGLAGLVKTVPDGMPPGSDTANLSVMGYDPRRYYTGRAPLEAISMGIDLADGDVAFRCNLVTLTGQAPDGPFAAQVMADYSAGEISSPEAHQLIQAVNDQLADDRRQVYAGKSYRHCLVWKQGSLDMKLVPPHDILTRVIGDHLPSGPDAQPLLDMMVASQTFLPQHPVNQARVQAGLNPGNAIWIWGQGVRPDLPNLADQHQLRGAVITAVDLIQGIGLCAGLEVITVPGATGTIDTNFEGKAQAAIDALMAGHNYIYLHVEAPDECGHHAQLDEKIRAIELIDEHIVGPVWQALEAHRTAGGEGYRLMVLPDHPTPLALRTHTSDPVPFAVYSSDGRDSWPAPAYDEDKAAQTGLYVAEGHELLGRFIHKGFSDLLP